MENYKIKLLINLPHALVYLNHDVIYVILIVPVMVLSQLIDYNDEVVHDVMKTAVVHTDQYLNNLNHDSEIQLNYPE